MKKVVINHPSNSSLAAQLIALYETLAKTGQSESVVFDFSQLKWAYPLLVLPISAYIQSTDSKVELDNCEVKSYLDTVSFPNGIDSVPDFELVLQQTRTYIPISVLKKDIGAGRDKLESMFAQLVYKQLASTLQGVQTAIYYPISELVTNIFEHSRENAGYIFAQEYPKKDYMDICIVDRGRGLRASYKDDRNIELTDEAAIGEVMKGHSVKANKERGFGVRTSKRVVCEGLKGNFVILSGSAALLSSDKGDNLVALPDFNWKGVIIAYRMPKPTEAFDFTRYVE